MHAPEAARETAHRAKRIQQLALLVVLHHLVRAAIEGPDIAILADVEQVQTRRIRIDVPLG